ncbi:PTS fructose transporter subunit IIABC [Nocardioides rubriscoriae]|uniref:PTS fructose transporter subunit IIABC n=1 Tax=Nocardioides rubriscoriae TaxID=642762 RepID=UPI0011DFE47C|nr:fructose-specific PTS transporter subunit EIIC [Nocardioides rubriscoriae]
MTDLITADLVRLDADLGTEKHDVIRALAAVVGSADRATDVERIVEDALAREAKSATGLKDGIAIPHCRTNGVDAPTLVFARLSPAVDFGAKDGPADLAFLITAPEGGDNTHLQILTKLARALVRKEFTDALRAATTPSEVVALVVSVIDPEPATAPASTHAASSAGTTGTTGTSDTSSGAGGSSHHEGPAATAVATRRVVAVTACPTGIAHTYMAAEALEAAAARAGVTIDVETQGSAGSTPLAPATIAAADVVIFAVDVGVRDRARFAGKPLVSSGVKRPIDEADLMIAEALQYADDPHAPRVEGASGGTADRAVGTGAGESWGSRTRRILMTGVSYMIPFVAAGGLLIALAFLLGGYEIALSTEDGAGVAGQIVSGSNLFNLPDPGAFDLAGSATLSHGALLTYLAALLLTIGGAAFSFLVPALAGYIAYAIADRPGIAPGFVMGYLANSVLGAGFLGGIVGGVLAGVIAHWIAMRQVPSFVRGLMPVVIIPLVSTLVGGLIMMIVLAKPLSALTDGLADGLNSLNGGSAVVLGVVLGLMMAFDMGGPLNKTAYVFATTGLSAAATATGDAPQLKIMAAVMLAGMVPPLAMALATVVRPALFNPAEKENGKAAWLLGASFITEGAIPFAAADPLRVIPSIMLGSAVTGGLAEALDVTLRAPHGGIFVLFAVGNILGFLVALLAGVAVATACVVTLKSSSRTPVAADLATV